MKQKVLRKTAVTAASLLLVAGVVLGITAGKGNREDPVEEETPAGEALAVMSEEEINALYEAAAPVQEAEDAETREAGEEGGDGTEGVDFAALWEVNPDVYAWITIPGTVIDYPVLQHPTDNSYYLNYNIDGSYGRPGCIYTENLNTKDFTDNNTVMYGHNMRNGTMFADLHKYEDETFFEEHPLIRIETPEEVLEYTVFAAYTYDDRHLMYSFDFADPEVYASYLEEVRNRRFLDTLIREDTEVTAEDRILTLSTCVSGREDKRFLVQAVLTSREKK